MTDSITSPTQSELNTVLFVGSNPGQASQVDVAFHGSTKSSKILTSWIQDVNGCRMHINVLNEKTPNNRPLKRSEIKLNLPQLKEQLRCIQPRRVVALGKTAAFALRSIGVEFFEMPHPSGRNRQLNDKEWAAQKIKEMTDYCNN
jgi:uracil-DNA glycosylase family 4